MKFLRTAIALAAIAGSASIAQAQSQTFTGSTTACFHEQGTPCTATSGTVYGGAGLFSDPSFTGIDSFSWAAFSGTPLDVSLGTFHFPILSCINDTSLCAPDDLKLHIAFATPPTSPSGTNFGADIDGAFGIFSGAAGVTFADNSKSFTFDGGTATLSIRDTSFVGLGDHQLHGQLLFTTTTPEPSSLALLGTGLFGLVPLVRRRRK